MTTANELIAATQAALTAEAVGSMLAPKSDSPASESTLTAYRSLLAQSLMVQLRNTNINGVIASANITPDMLSRLVTTFTHLRDVSQGVEDPSKLLLDEARPEPKPTQQSIFCDALLTAASTLTFSPDTQRPAPSPRSAHSVSSRRSPMPPLRRVAVPASIKKPEPAPALPTEPAATPVSAETQQNFDLARQHYVDAWQALEDIGVKKHRNHLVEALTGSTGTPFLRLNREDFVRALDAAFQEAKAIGATLPGTDYHRSQPSIKTLSGVFALIDQTHQHYCNAQWAMDAEQKQHGR